MLLFHATLSPCLNELVVVDRLTLRLLIDLGLWRTGLVQPVGLWIDAFHSALGRHSALNTCARSIRAMYFILLA